MTRLSFEARSPRRVVRRLLGDSRGATMVEYALMLFLILVAVSATVRMLGKTTRAGIDTATGKF